MYRPAGPAPATCRRAAAERRSPTGIAAAGRDTPAPSRKPETKTAKRRTRAVVAAPFPLARAPCGERKPWSFARCAGDAGRRPALHCRARFGRIAFSRQLARRAGRSLTRRNGYKHRIGSSDMYLPQDPLLRHVTRQPIPLQRHVPPGGRATATCGGPAGPAPATCISRGIGYCDMWLASRPRSSDMYLPRDRLLRHVTDPPTPLQRHVPAGGPATATCDGPATPLQRHVPPGGRATATCGGPADLAPATCTSRGTGYCDM